MAKNRGRTPVEFNSKQAKSKWDSLEGRADASIEALVNGKAGPADLQNLGSALKSMSEAAHQVFEEAVDAAQAAVEAAQEASGTQMTEQEHTEALNQALEPHIDELLAQIKTIIEIESDSQTDKLYSFMNDKFGELHKDVQATEDLLDPDNAEEGPQEPSDFEKLTAQINRLSDKIEIGQAQLQVHIDEQFEKLMRFVKGPDEKSGEGTSLNSGTSTSATSTTTKSKTGAALEKEKANKSDAEKEKDEDEKADTWWKSFTDTVWNGKTKRSDGGGGLKGILQDLGTLGLMTSLFDPDFWKAMGEGIEKALTWDNIKGGLSTAWDWLKEKTTGVVEYILQQLGVSKKTDKEIADDDTRKNQHTAEENKGNYDSVVTVLQKQGSPEKQAAFINSKRDWTGDLTTEGRALLAVASPETRKAYEKARYDESVSQRVGRGFHKIANFFTGKSNDNDGFDDVAHVGPEDADKWGGGDPSKTTQNSGSTQQRAPLSKDQSKPNDSTSINSTLPTSKDATTAPLPGVGVVDPGSGMNLPPLPAQGMPAVGLDSFSFTQGTNDNLLFMNSSMLGH